MNGDKMKIVKVVVATALAATALTAMLGASSASATVFCKTKAVEGVCPAGQTYATGTEFTAQTNFAAWYAPSPWQYCYEGTLKFKTTSEGEGSLAPVNAENTQFSFSACPENTPVTSLGTMSVTSTASNNGTAKQKGVQMKLPALHCTLGGYAEEGDSPATMNIIGGNPAHIKVESQLKNISGSCNKFYFTSEYEITAPGPVYVAQTASVLCKSNPEKHICSAGETYGVGTTISAQSASGTSIVFSSLEGQEVASCESGGFSGVVSVAGSESTSVRLNETKHTYSSCSNGTTVLGSGEAKIDWNSGANGLLSQTGGEFQLEMWGVKCSFSISGGEIQGGASPKLLYKNTTVVKTGGSFLCPKQMKVNAEYNIESPTPLYVEL